MHDLKCTPINPPYLRTPRPSLPLHSHTARLTGTRLTLSLSACSKIRLLTCVLSALRAAAAWFGTPPAFIGTLFLIHFLAQEFVFRFCFPQPFLRTMAAFLFKIKFGDTLRRLNVHQRYDSSGPDLTFNELEAKIREMFQIRSMDQLHITYTDKDSDVVTMGGDHDLEDACVIQGLNTVRLEVKIVDGASYVAAPIDTGFIHSLRQPAETKPVPEWDLFLRNSLPNLTPDVVKQLLRTYEPFIKAAALSGTISETLEGLVKAMTGPGSHTDSPTTATAPTSGDAKDTAAGHVPSFSSDVDNKATPDPECCSQRGGFEPEIMGRIFHRGVQCDGCGMMPIVGLRFKSLKKDNYDLCYSCYLDAGTEADYQKIDRPISARRNHYVCGPRMGLMRHHMGPPMGPPPPPAVPIGHPPPFKPFFPRGRYGWKNEFQGRSSTSPVTGNAFGEQTGGKLDARFVRDVTIFDGTELAPGTNFTKIWRLRNIGSLYWPQRTQLVFVGGDVLGLDSPVNLELPEQGLPPDEEIEASVDLVAPERPGRYVSHWRLMVPSGQKFGHRVWVLIQVVPKDEQSPQVQESLLPAQQVFEESKSEINLAEEKGVHLTNLDLAEEKGEVDFLKMDVTLVSPNKTAVVLVQDESPSAFTGDYVASAKQLEQTDAKDDSLVTVNSEVGGFSVVEKPVDLSPRQRVDSPITDYVNISGTFEQNQGADTKQPDTESNVSERLSLNVSGPLPGLPIAETPQQHAEELDMSSVHEGVQAIFEEALLEQLEAMGFNQRTLNYELLKKNKNNLQSTIEDLVAVTDWDPILVELEEMGFVDKEMNLHLMLKNNGSVKRVVKELVQMQVPAGKASAATAVKSKEKAL